MTNHAVVIAGGGPTGLMLAGELALARIDVAIVEKRASQDVVGSRAGGLNARTLEVLDQRGLAERFVAQGQRHPVAMFGIPLGLADAPSRHNYTLGLFQRHIERTLAEWVGELGVPIYRGVEVTGLAQDAAGVAVALSDGRTLRAAYLVGCDGGRSLVRKQAGIAFPGWDASTSYLIAEAEVAVQPVWGIQRDARGMHAIGPLEGGRARIVLEQPDVAGQPDEPSLADLKAALVDAFGTDYGVHSATWISRFTDMARQAAAYRAGRVLVAGDAAHVHSPVGGQGLTTGVQDAVNLGWKLAQVVRGTSRDALLDTYHAERHPVGARVLRNTLAQTALMRGDDRSKALQELMGELLTLDEARRWLAAVMTGLEIRYDLGPGHPLLGRRVPDLDLETATGPRRLFTLLHAARPVLLGFGAPLALGAWADRVDAVAARYAGAWELPALGVVPAPAAVLIRPDGYVAWVGDGGDAGLADALQRWF